MATLPFVDSRNKPNQHKVITITSTEFWINRNSDTCFRFYSSHLIGTVIRIKREVPSVEKFKSLRRTSKYVDERESCKIWTDIVIKHTPNSFFYFIETRTVDKDGSEKISASSSFIISACANLDCLSVSFCNEQKNRCIGIVSFSATCGTEYATRQNKWRN